MIAVMFLISSFSKVVQFSKTVEMMTAEQIPFPRFGLVIAAPVETICACFLLVGRELPYAIPEHCSSMFW
jgi:uncharacterized membrane protein YphA (DoxX/SURF4 family)